MTRAVYRALNSGIQTTIGGHESRLPEPHLEQIASWLESSQREAIGPAVELKRETNAEDEPPSVPEWIQILPGGQRTRGRDGREWENPDPQKIVEKFNRAGRPIPVDIEHMSELSMGATARAIGWVEEMNVRRGSVWGRVEWNGEGEFLVQNRAFRYTSPTIEIDVEENAIVGFSSVAITNHPNLRLRALNTKTQESPQEPTMDKELLAALGLSEDATPEQARNAAKDLADKANKADAATPPLDKYVPRSDYDAAMNKLSSAEAKLKEREEADQKAAIEGVVNKATKDGKITPAQREQAIAMCTSAGVEAFEAFVSAGQKVIDPSTAAPTEPAEGVESTLTEEQLEACKAAGIKPEDFAKERNKLAS